MGQYISNTLCFIPLMPLPPFVMNGMFEFPMVFLITAQDRLLWKEHITLKFLVAKQTKNRGIKPQDVPDVVSIALFTLL